MDSSRRRQARGAYGARAAVALITLAAVGCGPSGGGRRTNVGRARALERPLPVEANRNAPPPAEEEREPGGLPRLTLWCSQPTGPACTSAQLELGQEHTPAEAVPAELLQGARDLEDDCADPDLAPLMERVTGAVGVAVGGWTDQEGQILDASRVPDLYVGSGCTNAARPGDAPLKVQVVELEGQPYFFVRVWEVGDLDP